MRQDTSVGLPPCTSTSASWTYGGIEEHKCWHAPVHIVVERECGGLDHSFLCQNEAERPTHRWVAHCLAHRTSPWTSTKHRPATSTAAVSVNTNLVSRMVTCECVHYGRQGVQSACTMLLPHMQIEVFAADQSITSCWVAQQQLQLQFAFALASNGKHATDEHAQRSTRKVGRESAQKHAKVTV